MKSEYESASGILTVYPEWELDQQNAKELRTEIDRMIQKYKRANVLILDLSFVTFMDSSAIGVILIEYKNMRSKNGRLVIRNEHKNIERILRIAGIYKLIDTTDGGATK